MRQTFAAAPFDRSLKLCKCLCRQSPQQLIFLTTCKVKLLCLYSYFGRYDTMFTQHLLNKRRRPFIGMNITVFMLFPALLLFAMLMLAILLLLLLLLLLMLLLLELMLLTTLAAREMEPMAKLRKVSALKI